jgi:DNA-binding Lrp family transcriptional regulator
MSNKIRLDATDRAILHELSRDGKLSNVELADRVGLTPAPCLRRVKRLEEQGVITGYRARLDPVAAGRSFCVYIAVEITMTSREVVEEFEAALLAYDEVTEVRRVYGAIDYLVRVDVEDSNAYERFQTEKMYALPGVQRVVSHTTMSLIKSSS